MRATRVGAAVLGGFLAFGVLACNAIVGNLKDRSADAGSVGDDAGCVPCALNLATASLDKCCVQ
jgi:hypothetical protein